MAADPLMHLGHRMERPINRSDIAAGCVGNPRAVAAAECMIVQITLRDQPKRFQVVRLQASWNETMAGQRRTNGLAGASLAVEIHTLFVSRYSWTASIPLSRSTPECFMPPNGIM